MKIVLQNRQRRLKLDTKRVKKAAETILSALGYHDSELSVTIVGDRSIRRINRDYLGKDRPTNVISFSMREGEFGNLHTPLLGDVLISVDTAAREAEGAGMSLHARLCFLLLHGILHLTGYDHERSGETEARRMERKERDLFRMLERELLV